MEFPRLFILKSAQSVPGATHYIEQGDMLTFCEYPAREWKSFKIEGLNVEAKSLADLRIDPVFKFINETRGEWHSKTTSDGCISQHDYYSALREMCGGNAPYIPV